MIRADERRPTGAASEAWRPAASVPQIDLEQINTGVVMADFLAGFDAGRACGRLDVISGAWADGYRSGRLDESAERDAADEAEYAAEMDEFNKRLVKALASVPSYAELADRRGEPDRAAAQRAILAERGIA